MLDLIIKNGKLIDGSAIELGIQNGKIMEVAESIDKAAQKTLDLEKKHYLSAGWIDDHVHCYEKMELYYDFPDEIGVKKGVTSVIDAGTTGAENIGDFYAHAQEAITNVYALVNISKWGIVEQDELADLNKVQKHLVKEVLAKYPDFIVGIKARMSKTVVGENGIQPLHLAKEIQAENKDLSLMVHIGSAPPELEEVLNVLASGDVVTHCFNGKDNGILDVSAGKIKSFAWDAYQRGVIFDVGHGTESFSFKVAEKALEEGMKATTISTDIYSRNRLNGPVFDFATTMEKMRVVGYSWEEIIEKVTATPAQAFHLAHKGFLMEGYDADITIFDIIPGEKSLIDSVGERRNTKEIVQPVKTIIGGKLYEHNL